MDGFLARAKPWQRLTGVGGRDLALAALAESHSRGAFVRETLDRLATARKAPAEEWALASELALGVTRHRLTLDRIVATFLARRLSHLDALVLDVLRLGAYQLVYLDRIPDFAAVNEAVTQCQRVAGRKAAGLVNAVLRELIRKRAERRVPWTRDPDPTQVRVDVGHACAFTDPILPDAGTDVAEYLSAATSHPVHLVRRWVNQFGVERAEAALWCGTLRPPLILRANRLRCDPQELAERLRRDDLDAVAQDDAVFVAGAAPPASRLPAFMRGLCQPQDPTAMAVVRQARPVPSERMLDLCAAPGTKATFAAELRGDKGRIVASDRNRARLALTRDNCRRLGIRSVRLVEADALDALADRTGRFDLILVDVPCSNTGVLSRRPEARYRLRDESLATLHATQSALLDRAASLATPGGRIVYSTCSLEPEENEQVVEEFVRSHRGWRVVRSERTFPRAGAAVTDWRDGGCSAELRICAEVT